MIEQGPDLAAFVTLTVAGWTPGEIPAALARDGIVVSTPARAYAPPDMEARGLLGVVRIAPHLTTTAHDLDTLIAALEHFAASGQA